MKAPKEVEIQQKIVSSNVSRVQLILEQREKFAYTRIVFSINIIEVSGMTRILCM